ncbi:hypothetical protein N9N67_07185 [Bacteriovoracaceae bacterium]|nr:hypothetical protein [Bacteriovoracaceae bacterium]
MFKLPIYLILIFSIACSNSKKGVSESSFGIPFLGEKKIKDQNRKVSFHKKEQLEDAPGHHQKVIKDLGIDNASDEELARLAEIERQKELKRKSGGDYGSNQEQTYVVQRYDTLMLISFKLFGDYEKWRHLVDWNPELTRPGRSLQAGDQLKYFLIYKTVTWNPTGNPYLIKESDTLGVISQNAYDTPVYWKEIWNNNKPLIKDPNVIFAGFTIYTPVINTRSLAGKKIEDETENSEF